MPAHAKLPLDRDALGRAVQELRLERGLSREALAAQAGLHRVYLTGIESGERNPAVAVLARIAAALRVSPAALLARGQALQCEAG